MTRIASFEEGALVLLEGKGGKNAVTVKSCSQRPLNAAVFDGAQVKDAEAFKTEVAAAVSEAGFRNKEVRILLTNYSVLLRELVLPAAKGKELDAIVHNEMLYALGSIDEYAVDYVVVEELAGKQLRILAIALANRTIEDILENCAAAGLKVGSIDVAFNALAQLTATIYPQLGTAVVLQINGESVDINLIEKGFCFLARNVRLNIHNFTSTDTLDIMAEELADHIQRVIQFQRSRRRDHEVEALLLLCEDEQAEQVSARLSPLLPIPCQLFEGGDRLRGNYPMALCAKAAGALLSK